MIKEFKIKNLTIKNNLFLAPMAGYTDVGFRSLCKDYGAGLTFTEMISAKALAVHNKKTIDLLAHEDKEHPIAVQLFGKDPDDFESAIKSGFLDDFDIIDLNMGCPAPKIVKNHEGSFLMTDINLAKSIIERCVKVTNKPISVKFRSGYTENNINAIEFAKMCEKAGASFVTIHARTTQQGYSGHSDWALVKKLTKELSIPVVASGDVRSRQDADYLTDVCCASAVMIGRNALGNPEIFEEILSNKQINLSIQSKIIQIEKHSQILSKFFTDKFVDLTMKKHVLYYVKNFENATKIKIKLCECKTVAEMVRLLKDSII